MSRSKENHSQLSHQDYIRYLYQEGVRKGIHKKSNFYSELIKFVNSSQGQEGFNKFINLSPHRVGISVVEIKSTLRRAF